MIKNIIFDFDGVLVDSEILVAKAISKYFADRKINFKEKEFSKFAGKKTFQIISELSLIFNISDKQSFFNDIMSLADTLFSNELQIVLGVDNFLKVSDYNTQNHFLKIIADYGILFAFLLLLIYLYIIFGLLQTKSLINNNKFNDFIKLYLLSIVSLSIIGLFSHYNIGSSIMSIYWMQFGLFVFQHQYLLMILYLVWLPHGSLYLVPTWVRKPKQWQELEIIVDFLEQTAPFSV